MSESNNPAALEHLARILRHEVADLLQGLYSVAAILQMRLPEAYAMEKQLLGHLKNRGEELRTHLDGLTQLTTRPPIERIEQNLAEALRVAVERTQRQHPTLPLSWEMGPSMPVWADPVRLLASCVGLTAALAEGAKALQVSYQARGEQAVAVFHRVGSPASTEQLRWLQQPFLNTHFSPLAIQLALAMQWLPAVGGDLLVSNEPNGVQLQLSLVLVCSSEGLK